MAGQDSVRVLVRIEDCLFKAQHLTDMCPESVLVYLGVCQHDRQNTGIFAARLSIVEDGLVASIELRLKLARYYSHESSRMWIPVSDEATKEPAALTIIRRGGTVTRRSVCSFLALPSFTHDICHELMTRSERMEISTSDLYDRFAPTFRHIRTFCSTYGHRCALTRSIRDDRVTSMIFTSGLIPAVSRSKHTAERQSFLR
jgi:hypothetical protein